MNKNKTKYFFTLVTLTFIIFLMFSPLVHALVINIDETLPAGTTWINPENVNASKTLMGEGQAYNESVIITGTPSYIELPYASRYDYKSADFVITPEWTFSWVSGETQYAYESNYFRNSDFDFGDVVTNATFNITSMIVGGANGKQVVQNGATQVLGYGRWGGTYGYGVYQSFQGDVSYTQGKEGYLACYYELGQTQTFINQIGSYCIYKVPIENRTHLNSLILDVRIADLPSYTFGVGFSKLAGAIYVKNFRTGGWDTILYTNQILGSALGTYGINGSVSVSSYYENAFTFYDAATGDASPYGSGYSHGYAGGYVEVMLCTLFQYTAGSIILPAPGEAAVLVDYLGISEIGYDNFTGTEDIPLTINGYSSNTTFYVVPDTYYITQSHEGEVGPYAFSETYYLVESSFYLGNAASLSGYLNYTNDNVSKPCGSYGNSWVVSLDEDELDKSINSSGFFVNNWSHVVGGVPQSTQLNVKATFYFETTDNFSVPSIMNGILDVSINYDSRDTKIQLYNFTIINSTRPISVELQTIDITQYSTFSMGNIFPYGDFSFPSNVGEFEGINTILLKVTYDTSPPEVPASYSQYSVLNELQEARFSLTPSDSVAYVFLIYNDSSGNTYYVQLQKDFVSSDYYVTLKFFRDEYHYWYYMVDDAGNVRTTDSTTLNVIVLTLISINVNGLLSWIAIIAAIVGGSVVVSQTKYKKNMWIYVGIIGAGAAVLVLMSFFGLFPVTLNLLALETANQAISPFAATISYTILGVGIAASVIGGYFIFKYLTKK